MRIIYCCVEGCPYKAVGWIECRVGKRFLAAYEFTGEVRAFCLWHGIVGLGSKQEQEMKRLLQGNPGGW